MAHKLWVLWRAMGYYGAYGVLLASSRGFDKEVFNLKELIGPLIWAPSPPGDVLICSFDGTLTSFGSILFWNDGFGSLNWSFKCFNPIWFDFIWFWGGSVGLLTAGRLPSTFGDIILLFLDVEIFVWSHLFSLVKFDTLGLYASCSKFL